MWFSYTVSQPLVLELRSHLLVDDNLLQLLQRRMMTHLVLKGQEVLTYRACVSEHMHRYETTVFLVHVFLVHGWCQPSRYGTARLEFSIIGLVST